jgi:phosphatidylserine decarboxylase
VTDVTHLGPECILGCDAVQVGVFMSIFDVHVNRSPADGEILDVTHRDGSLLDVRRPEAWGTNEAATILMQIDLGPRPRKIAFRQIAGLVARRIVTDLEPGRIVSRGQRIGMIRFGSRGELIVPADLVEQVEVRIGQKVQAGKTVLLRCRREENAVDT